jgi:manganese oxidase
MAMSWRPEREGNWLFHCHISAHVSSERRLSDVDKPHDIHHDAHHGSPDNAAGMAGMVLGVTVLGKDQLSKDSPPTPSLPPRKLTLTMTAEWERFGADPAYGFVLTGDRDPSSGTGVSVPAPTLVLRRGEPVEIALVNRLPEATAIHWHGMELDSYYDGVHGWSGIGQRVTPLIEPGETFRVRFTPPRAGTFIYHTHLHDDRQLRSGLYGALLVLEPDEPLRPGIRSRCRHRTRWSWRRCACDLERQPRSAVRLESWRAPSATVHQHHAGRSLCRIPRESRWP